MIYKPSGDSLRLHPTPKWFKESKFGIYTPWRKDCDTSDPRYVGLYGEDR